MLVKPTRSSHRRVRGNKAWEWGGGFFKTGRRAAGQERHLSGSRLKLHASRLTPQHVPCGGGDDLTEQNHARLDQVLQYVCEAWTGNTGDQGTRGMRTEPDEETNGRVQSTLGVVHD